MPVVPKSYGQRLARAAAFVGAVTLVGAFDNGTLELDSLTAHEEDIGQTSASTPVLVQRWDNVKAALATVALGNNPDETPTFVATTPLDEDFWPPQPAPTKLAFRPFAQGDEEISLTPPPPVDEDLWPPVPAPAKLVFRPFSQVDGEETPAGALYGQPDEDFWTTRPASIVGA